MSRFWSPVVHGLSPYIPGEQPKLDNLIKLNTNENPYPPSPRVLDALRDALFARADQRSGSCPLYPRRHPRPVEVVRRRSSKFRFR